MTTASFEPWRWAPQARSGLYHGIPIGEGVSRAIMSLGAAGAGQVVLAVILAVIFIYYSLVGTSPLFGGLMTVFMLCCSGPLYAALWCSGLSTLLAVVYKESVSLLQAAKWGKTCAICWCMSLILTLGVLVVTEADSGGSIAARQLGVVVGANGVLALLQGFSAWQTGRLVKDRVDLLWRVQGLYGHAIPVSQPLFALRPTAVQPLPAAAAVPNAAVVAEAPPSPQAGTMAVHQLDDTGVEAEWGATAATLPPGAPSSPPPPAP